MLKFKLEELGFEENEVGVWVHDEGGDYSIEVIGNVVRITAYDEICGAEVAWRSFENKVEMLHYLQAIVKRYDVATNISYDSRLIKMDGRTEFVRVEEDRYVAVEMGGVEMTFGEVMDEIAMRIAREMHEVYGPAH